MRNPVDCVPALGRSGVMRSMRWRAPANSRTPEEAARPVWTVVLGFRGWSADAAMRASAEAPEGGSETSDRVRRSHPQAQPNDHPLRSVGTMSAAISRSRPPHAAPASLPIGWAVHHQNGEHGYGSVGEQHSPLLGSSEPATLPWPRHRVTLVALTSASWDTTPD